MEQGRVEIIVDQIDDIIRQEDISGRRRNFKHEWQFFESIVDKITTLLSETEGMNLSQETLQRLTSYVASTLDPEEYVSNVDHDYIIPFLLKDAPDLDTTGSHTQESRTIHEIIGEMVAWGADMASRLNAEPGLNIAGITPEFLEFFRIPSDKFRPNEISWAIESLISLAVLNDYVHEYTFNYSRKGSNVYITGLVWDWAHQSDTISDWDKFYESEASEIYENDDVIKVARYIARRTQI